MKTLAESRFRHEALFYRTPAEFLAGTLGFIDAALKNGEPIMVAVAEEKTKALRAALGTRGEMVEFAAMESLGANPARIISAWRDFAEAHPASSMRGIGEPAWPGRDEQELIECDHHESLLNLALSRFEMRLLCPYDAEALDTETLAAARRNHPYLSGPDGERTSPGYEAPNRRPNPLHVPLTAAPERATELEFAANQLGEIRNYVAQRALRAAVLPPRASDVALAVHELATNSVEHGGGNGTLLVWHDDEHFYCEVRDRGQINDPLVGRVRATEATRGGRGVWLVHQLCDLVQVRAAEPGSAVRVRMAIDRTTP